MLETYIIYNIKVNSSRYIIKKDTFGWSLVMEIVEYKVTDHYIGKGSENKDFEFDFLIPKTPYQSCLLRFSNCNSGFMTALRACLIDEIPVRGLTIFGNYHENITARKDEVDTIPPEAIMKAIQAIRINQTTNLPEDCVGHLDVTNNNNYPIPVTSDNIVFTNGKKEVIRNIIPPHIPICILNAKKHLKITKIKISTGKAHFNRHTANANLYSGLPIFGYKQLDEQDKSCLMSDPKQFEMKFDTYIGDSAVRLIRLGCKELIDRVKVFITEIKNVKVDDKETLNQYVSILSKEAGKRYTFMNETKSFILAISIYCERLGVKAPLDVNNEAQNIPNLCVFHTDADNIIVKAAENFVADLQKLHDHKK